MRVVKSAVIFMAVIFLASFHVHAGEKLSGQHILATAKVTGACGILDSMISFQNTTKLPGGDAFVYRFWEYEAARRGMSVKEVSDQCNAAVTLYDELWQSMSAAKE